jgi:hypothetical protein
MTLQKDVKKIWELVIPVQFLSEEQRNMAGTWFRLATQNNIMFKNRMYLGYIRRPGCAPWEHSKSSLNQILQEHTQAHGSVCWNHMFGDVGLVSTPALNI